ncbi:MAG: adenylate/guanylate cyclase domain-containing protein [Planctomycetota bacterium]
MFDIDWDALSFDDFSRLRDELVRQMRRRFEREVALVFTDIVGSTDYFASHGSVAGEALLRRHEALLVAAMRGRGRVIDFAGDGAFCAFDDVEAGLDTLVVLQERIALENGEVGESERLSVRSGLHFGPALVSESKVRGDSVNFAARVASGARGGEVRLSKAAVERLSPERRVRCLRLPDAELKGFPGRAELSAYDWRDPNRYPTRVVLEQTGESIALPCQDRITLGRLSEHAGERTNDIVLKLQDAGDTLCISRWHIALEQAPSGYEVRSLSTKRTVVDGRELVKGEKAPIRPGATVLLSDVLTLRFEGPDVDPSLAATIDPE